MQKEIIYDSLAFVTQGFTLVKQTNCFVNTWESLYHAYVRIFCVTGRRECRNVVNCSILVKMGEKGDVEG